LLACDYLDRQTPASDLPSEAGDRHPAARKSDPNGFCKPQWRAWGDFRVKMPAHLSANSPASAIRVFDPFSFTIFNFPARLSLLYTYLESPIGRKLNKLRNFFPAFPTQFRRLLLCACDLLCR
jgi:hypothetical protein